MLFSGTSASKNLLLIEKITPFIKSFVKIITLSDFLKIIIKFVSEIF